MSHSAPQRPPQFAGFLRFLRKATYGTIAAVLLLALVEGLLSFASVGRAIATKTIAFDPLTEVMVIHFDPDLGWSPTPGFRDTVTLGPERPITIGAHGFRGARPVEPHAPAGKVRALVCGDSFAFGTGVADDETWEMELERLDPRLETVNFGVGGYGLDQAWLRYRRDGASVEHRLVIVAFITEDLVRMVTPMPWGADRPWLGITGDELEVRNVPVIKSPHVLRSLRQAGFFARELYLGKVIGRLAEDDAASSAADDREANMRQLTLRLIAEFAALARQRGAHAVFVHLPIETERSGGTIDTLRNELAAKAAAVGADWIDLLAEFRALSEADHARLFLHRPAAAAGHYDIAGTAFIGALLHQKLQALPAVKQKLDAAPR